jgi:hypothetical protein
MNEPEQKSEKSPAESNFSQIPDRAAFLPDEMAVCGKCGRLSPPTRSACMYCGTELEVTAAVEAHPPLRKLEGWENGFNVIIQEGGNSRGAGNTSETARRLGLSEGDLNQILAAPRPVPVCRVESEADAALIINRLAGIGIQAALVPDTALGAAAVPRRLKGMEFSDGVLVLKMFSSEDVTNISRDDFCLTVRGAYFETKIEASEKLKRKRESVVTESAEINFDYPLLDIYSLSDHTGFRITSNGFDFSCLGSEKGLLAADNMRSLFSKLKEFAPQAFFDENYVKARRVLEFSWPAEQRTDSSGVKRGRMGGYKLENVTSTNNLMQFTKYSRMLRRLL